MNRYIYKKTATLLAVMTLIPVMCSCTMFKKKAVVTAATAFGEAIQSGDGSGIVKKTDGLDQEYKKEIKSLFKFEGLSDEDKAYCSHMLGTVSFETDESTFETEDNTASILMNFTIADYKALDGGDYKDINALCDAVDNGPTRTIGITVEFEELDKEWYVTNFDSEEFKDLLSFFNDPMPAIGRGTLLANAASIAESVVKDDPSLAINVAASYDSPDMIDMNAYINNLFDVSANTSDEDKAFRAAVLSTMTYKVDESTLVMDSKYGSVDITITMADYGAIADKTFKKADEIAPAIQACPTITYTYTCHFIRDGAMWYATDLDSEGYADFLRYKKFSVNMKRIDGTYKASVDVTEKFIAYVESGYSVKMPSDLTGRITITTTLVLKNGKYEITVDRDLFVANIKAFVEANIDKIIQNTLGTSSSVGLDTLAKVAGYKDYADMRQSILKDVTASLESIDTSGLESSGTFTLNDNAITLQSTTDTMPGSIDNYGTITVTIPVKDADAKKLLGSDTVTLAYKKV